MTVGPRSSGGDRADAPLVAALEESRRLGMLGARPIPEVIEHARSFVRALADVRGAVIDLGSGGGVPGLVVAWDRPDLRVVLVDRRTKRTDLLHRLVGRLGMASRVEVLAGDAEDLGRQPPHRHAYAAVTSRGFGPPLHTLRVAERYLGATGIVVISEPPEERPDRWPADAPAELGLEVVSTDDPSVRVFRRR